MMLHIAIVLTGLYFTFLSLLVGWLLGARLGDDRGIIAYALATLSAAATLFYTLS